MFDKLADLLVLVWHQLKPIIFILQYETGVQFRGGKYLKVLTPGIHFKIPFVDDIHIESTAEDKITIDEVNINTLDNKTISIGGVLELKVIDAYKAFINAHNWRENIVDISRGIISDYLEDCTWEDIKLKKTKNAIFRSIKSKAEEMGIDLLSFTFTDKANSRVYKIVTHKPKESTWQ